MRYFPTNGSPQPFAPTLRPRMEDIPEPLRAPIAERDRLTLALADAEREVRRLAERDRDTEAKAADDKAAADAIRAGKSLPPAKAAAKLAEDRANATRLVEATRAALAAADSECSEKRWQLSEKIEPTMQKRRAEIIGELTAKADALADAVDAAVREVAVADWLHTGHHRAVAITWATDIIPALANHAMSRTNAPQVQVRDILTRAVTAVIATDEN